MAKEGKFGTFGYEERPGEERRAEAKLDAAARDAERRKKELGLDKPEGLTLQEKIKAHEERAETHREKTKALNEKIQVKEGELQLLHTERDQHREKSRDLCQEKEGIDFERGKEVTDFEREYIAEDQDRDQGRSR